MRKNLSHLFSEFLFEAEFVKKLRPSTLRYYSNTFGLFIKLQPEIILETLNTASVIDFFKKLQDRQRIAGKGIIKTGVKKSTVSTYWRKLNCFFEWLATKDYIKVNPLASVTCPTPSYEDRKFLQKTEIEKLLTALYTHHDNNLLLLKRNLLVFHLFLFCGLRREELLQLQVRDIDVEKKLLTVRGDICKTGITRQIPLHSSVLLHFKDYMAIRKSYTTQYLIVSSERDEKLTGDGLKHLVEKIKKCSGVSFHLHQLRHTFAVNFLKTSNNIAKLKQLLGHKSIVMTLTYLRCLPVDEFRSDIESMSIDKLM